MSERPAQSPPIVCQAFSGGKIHGVTIRQQSAKGSVLGNSGSASLWRRPQHRLLRRWLPDPTPLPCREAPVDLRSAALLACPAGPPVHRLGRHPGVARADRPTHGRGRHAVPCGRCSRAAGSAAGPRSRRQDDVGGRRYRDRRETPHFSAHSSPSTSSSPPTPPCAWTTRAWMSITSKRCCATTRARR